MLKNTFLHGELQEKVDMMQPSMFVDPQYPTHVCRLHKAHMVSRKLPGLGSTKLRATLLHVGFISSKSDNSLFIHNSHGKFT